MTTVEPAARAGLDVDPPRPAPFTAESPSYPSGAARAAPELVVRPIDTATHAAYARQQSAGYRQHPSWAPVEQGWRSESVGWYEGRVLVGTALVLYRPVPGSRRSLAYVPEGPSLPWARMGSDPGRWLTPFVEHLRDRLAFAVRIGPTATVRVWSAQTTRRGLADPAARRFADLPADTTPPAGGGLAGGLKKLGWRRADRASGGFEAGPPSLRVRLDLREKNETDLLAGMNQQWRRNIARSVRAGVTVREGSAFDLGAFHQLYLQTAERDGFTPRPAAHFDRMWQALARPDGGHRMMRLYLARVGPDPLAAAITVQVGGHCWYAYGASTARDRSAQASTALQWHAIRAARARGCHTYDLSGVADSLDEADPLGGPLRFNAGLGGECVETAGEWELSIAPLWHRVLTLYLRARS